MRKKMYRLNSFGIQQAVLKSKVLKILELKPTTKLILWALISFYNKETGMMYPSQTTLGDMVGINRTNTNRSIAELTTKKVIVKTCAKGLNNNYRFDETFLNMIAVSHDSGNIAPVPNPHTPLYQSDTLTCAKLIHNNNSYNNNLKYEKFKNLKNTGTDLNANIRKTKDYLEVKKNIKLGSPVDIEKNLTLEDAKNILKLPNIKNSALYKTCLKKIKEQQETSGSNSIMQLAE